MCRLLQEDEAKALKWEAEEMRKERNKILFQLRKKEWEYESIKMERYGVTVQCCVVWQYGDLCGDYLNSVYLRPL